MLWTGYNQRKRKIEDENWGLGNEVRAFLAASEELNATNLHSFQSSGKEFCTNASTIHYKFNKRSGVAKSQMILCRIAAGRVRHRGKKTLVVESKHHSDFMVGDIYKCRGNYAYPEYIITYRDNSAHAPSSDEQENTGRSASKMCIICMERPVRYLCAPCGHPCLCEKCNNSHTKAKLKGKCPECRARFQSTVIIYGRVVNDE